jgi:DNA-directed RNA polymerase subunit omega
LAATPAVEGIINPPIDDLLEVVDSKYGLVIMASKRARQINAYYAQLGEGLLEYVGPLVETRNPQEKPLSIALREISDRLLTAETPEA